MRGLYAGKNIQAIVDVWCETPVQRMWKKFADSGLTKEDRETKWGGIEYWFVMVRSSPSVYHLIDRLIRRIGVHP